MSETSPTEGDSDAGSQVDLPANNQQPSADEQQTDSVSGGSQDTDQNDNNQPQDGSTGDDSSSSDDDGLNKFAKSQGIENLDELSDRERKLLKTAHDNQKAFRTSKQEQSDKLRDTVNDVHNVADDELEDLDPTDVELIRTKSDIAQLRAEQKVNNFYIRNPEAKEYDKEMTDLVVEEMQANGRDAARYLSQNLDRLLTLAKARRETPEDLKADGAREERERLRKRQEGSGESGQARDSNDTPKKVSREDIVNMSDEDYTKWRDGGGLQEALDRGDLY